MSYSEYPISKALKEQTDHSGDNRLAALWVSVKSKEILQKAKATKCMYLVALYFVSGGLASIESHAVYRINAYLLL